MRTVIVLAAMTCLVLGYVTSYAALASPSIWDSARYPGQVEERYPLLERGSLSCTAGARIFYYPVNWCDRQLRPEAWERACIW